MKVSAKIAALTVIILIFTCCAAAGGAKPAPVNPYNGMQTREEVFEFSQKPTIEKVGDKWIIAFASKGKCDATVAILGPDGKIVRHLVSGVLGKNAPWPFQQNSLVQRIEWDGLTDDWQKAPGGCKVRVSLGLKPVLDRVLLDWFTPPAGIAGLAISRRGELYVLSKGGHGCDPSVQVFDKQGHYVRTIMPHHANLPPERVTLCDWTKTTFGRPVIKRTRSGGSTTLNRCRFPGFQVPRQSPVVTPDGRFVFVSDKVTWRQETPGRKLILLDGRDGATPPGSVLDADQGSGRRPEEAGVLGDGEIFMTMSPDTRWLYLGSPESRDLYTGDRETFHTVCRISLEKPGPAEPFLGEQNKPGRDNRHFNRPRGLACDQAGNLLVADYGNDRIQVFRPDGTHFRTLGIEKPVLLAVHPKTTEIYVLSQWDKGEAKLFKLGGLHDPMVRARLDLPASPSWTICLDATASPPALWLASGGNTWRVEDRGDHFEMGPGLTGPATSVEVQMLVGGGPGGRIYVAADPFREELYVRSPSACFASPVLRLDGRTGKFIDKLRPALNIYVGPNKLVYMDLYRYASLAARALDARLGPEGTDLRAPSRWFARYHPDTREYLQFPEGISVRGDGKIPEGWEGAPLGPYIPSGPGRGYQAQLTVAPNGDIYFLVPPSHTYMAYLQKAGLPRPTEALNEASLLTVFSSEGKLKSPNVLPGLRASGRDGNTVSVRVGRGGAVYLGAAYRPVGQTVPDGIAPEEDYPPRFWGTIIKFNSSFGKFPVGRMIGSWEKLSEGEQPTHIAGPSKPLRIENLLWSYGGMGQVHTGCTCTGFSLDLDRFERVFLPAPQTCSVNVLDANGNLVLRAGAYGNADSRGKDSPVLDPKTGLLRPRRRQDPADLQSPLSEPDLAFCLPQFVAVTDEALYVCDAESMRIIRAALSYEAEGTVPLP